MATAITRYQGEMMFETEVGGQRITTDVTPPMGGQGRAPTPPDLFVASIGACIAAFVAHYCEKQGISTKDLVVETTYGKNEKPAFLTDFKVDVQLPDAECGERHEAVRRVADQCIIHETLHHLKDIQIVIRDRADLAAEA